MKQAIINAAGKAVGFRNTGPLDKGAEDAEAAKVAAAAFTTSLTARGWLNLLTDSEETAATASTSVPVKRALNRLRIAAGEPMEPTERTIVWLLTALENAGIIDSGRKTELQRGKPV